MPPKKKPAKKVATKTTKKALEKLTPNELMLDYKIGLSRSALMELEFKKAKLLDEISTKEGQLNALNEQSRREMKETLNKWNEFKKSEKENFSSTEVVEYMHANWKVKEEEQKRLRAIEEEIKQVQTSIADTREEIDRWKYFESKTMPSNNAFIAILRQEIDSMTNRYDSFVENLQRAFAQKKSTYFDQFHAKLEAIRKESVDTAVRKLDNRHWTVVEQEEWFRKELTILKQREEELIQRISRIEQANIAICENLAQDRLNPILWPNRMPDNFPDSQDELCRSRALDLELESYFNRLDLRPNQSLVDEVVTDRLEQDGVGFGRQTTTSKTPKIEFSAYEPGTSTRSMKETLLAQNMDTLLTDLTDSSRWNRLLAVGSEESRLLTVRGISPRSTSPVVT